MVTWVPVILGMPSSLGTGRVTMMPWAVPTHNNPWQISRLVTLMLFWPRKRNANSVGGKSHCCPRERYG